MDSFPVRTNVLLDRQSAEASRELPRKVSTSAILRVILMCLTSSDRAFERWLDEDPKRLEVAKYIGKSMKTKWNLFL
jgi:hypothetical protein